MTEKHYLERELEAKLASDSSIWEFLRAGSLDGCWYWDLENPANEWMSPEFWRLFGIDPATKAHKASEWQDIIHPDDRDVALANFHKHLADPNHPYDQVVRYRHADGSTVWVRCRGIAIRDETGKPVRLLGAHTDLTAAEHALAQRRMAEAASEELRTFAYSVSHDMKAPANTVKALLHEVVEHEAGGLSGAGREMLAEGIGILDRMRGMIEDLLAYTRLFGDEWSRESVDLGDVVATVLRDLRPALQAAGARVDVGPLPVVRGDRGQLARLFDNLLSNALKFRHAERAPVIRVQADSVDGSHRISVVDDGIGIDPRHHDEVFAMFRRLHTHADYPGVGLGLTLCRRVASNHGGELTVESTAGDGATFTLSLPERGTET